MAANTVGCASWRPGAVSGSSPNAGCCAEAQIVRRRREQVEMSIRRRHALPIRAELTGSATATALGISARSNSPILTLCRLLIRAGHNPSARLEAHRGSTLCLRVCSIGEGARLTVKEPNGGRAHFAKWTAFPSSPVASRAQEKELRGHGSPAAGRKAGSTPPESATRPQLGPRRFQRVSAGSRHLR